MLLLADRGESNMTELLESNHGVDALAPTCRFCGDNLREVPLFDDDGGIVLPSVGAMIEGWLIAFPTRHVLSLAELSDIEWSAFDILLRSARKRVEQMWGSTVMFEHGSAGVGRLAACGVDHAHMHIVPIQLDLRGAIAACSDEVGNYSWTPVFERVERVVEQDYIFVSDRTGNWVARSDNLPGQVVRRAIAKWFDYSDWDWKVNARMHVVEATRQKLTGR
jgi:ATP adenylyltransferase